jgi:hypothetical protein
MLGKKNISKVFFVVEKQLQNTKKVFPSFQVENKNKRIVCKKK